MKVLPFIAYFGLVNVVTLVYGTSCDYDTRKASGPLKQFVDEFLKFKQHGDGPVFNGASTTRVYQSMFSLMFYPTMSLSTPLGRDKRVALKTMEGSYKFACENKYSLMTMWPFSCKPKQYSCNVNKAIINFFDFYAKKHTFSSLPAFTNEYTLYIPPSGYDLRLFYLVHMQNGYLVFLFNPKLDFMPIVRKRLGQINPSEYTLYQYMTLVFYYISSSNKNGLDTFNKLYKDINVPSGVSCSDSNAEVFCVVSVMRKEINTFVAEISTWNKKSKNDPLPYDRAEKSIRWLLKPTVWKYVKKYSQTVDKWRQIQKFLMRKTVTDFISKYSTEVMFHYLLRKDLSKLNSFIQAVKQSELYRTIPNTFSPKVLNNVEKLSDSITRLELLVSMCCTSVSNIVITAADFNMLAGEVYNVVYDKVYANDKTSLAAFLSKMPLITDLKKSSSGTCASLRGLNTKNPRCAFQDIFNSVNVLLKSQQKAKVNTKVLYEDNSDENKLEDLLTRSVIGMIQRNQQNNEANHLQVLSEITKKMANGATLQGLKSYFTGMANYDTAKATADIGFIKGRLASFEATLKEVKPYIEKSLGGLIKAAIVINSGDLVQKVAMGVVAAAQSANPFNVDPAGVMAVLDEIANKAVDVARGAILLKTHLPALKKKGDSICKKLSKNTAFINKVISLVNNADSSDSSSSFKTSVDQFLDEYNAYDPQVRKNDLSGYAKLWDIVVESACDLVFTDTGTTSTAPARIYALSTGACEKSKVNIVRINEVFMEMYEYQFDMMETLAKALRAKISGKAAKNLDSALVSDSQQALDDLNEKQIELRKSALNSFVLFRIDTVNKLQGYCDVVEYEIGGQPHPRCQAALRTLSYNEISSLLNRHVHGCELKSNVKHKAFIIPTTQDKLLRAIEVNGKTYQLILGPKSPLLGNLNLDLLYDGKPAIFRIPDAQWLVDNDWIRSSQKDRLMYIKSFEIFPLPTETNTAREVYTTVQTYDMGRFRIDGPKYFVYRRSTVSKKIKPLTVEPEYSENQSCQAEKKDNPYGIHYPQVCLVKPGSFPHVYPSVFSTFKVQMSTSPSSPKPRPASDLYLKARIALCDLGNDGNLRRRRRSVSSPSKIKSCTKNNFWSQKNKKCEPCPIGSVSAMFGYYCKRV